MNKGELTLTTPGSDLDWYDYYDLRWRVLRKAWNQPRGSERDELDSTSFHLMLRGESGAVVATGRLHLNSSEEAQVRYMAVDESSRSRGLGGQILRGLEQEAREKAVRRIVLNAREGAIKFYLKHGYGIEARAETLFGEILHMRMSKDVSAS
jgi:predicted GNAT family N-acyltransferase